MTRKKKKLFGGKKLLPAIAMLIVSAIMLSTATYAWFTMNKEVEVTGLKMQATAGDALEISLGAKGTKESPESSPTQKAPGVNDISWKQAINIDEYYEGVGYLKPASSDTGLKLYYVEGSQTYNGGKDVKTDAPITVATNAQLALDGASNDTFGPKADKAEGYFIDVPMWIRTNKTAGTSAINCKVTITDSDTPNEDLMKAVRVAIIPIGGGSTSDELAKELTSTINNPITGSTPNIFALDDSTYYGKVIDSNTSETVYKDAALVAAPSIINAATGADDSTHTGTTVFTIPAATTNDYAGYAFIARVWIEGESTYCNDATANQNWNIDFKFSVVSGS